MKRWLTAIVAGTFFLCSNSMLPAANPPPEKSTPAKSDAKVTGRPFRGTLKSVDQKEKKIVLEGAKAQTFSILKETRIFKDDQPAKLGDLIVGEPITGYAQKNREGTWEARTVYGGKHVPKSKS